MQKFSLRDFAGKPVAYFKLTGQDLPEPSESDSLTELSHHIIVVDRSGSMYYDVESMKSTLLKLLTLEEYQNAELLVSLISYSSQGDVTCHFGRSRIQEVMAPGSSQQEEIKRIRVTGLTCISRAMEVAKGLIREGELTAVSLHSDGYANDPSPFSEKRSLTSICGSLVQGGDVLINTIAYSRYSDFNMLNLIANLGSGACVQADSLRQVYDALQSTTQTLVGKTTPTLVEPIREDDFQVFVSQSGKRINGSAGDLRIAGIRAEDDKVLYRYQEIDQSTYKAMDCPVVGEGTSPLPLYAYARAQLSEGNLNRVKYALVSSRNETLLSEHSRALTTPSIAAMATDLDKVLFEGADKNHHFTESYGLDMSEADVLRVVSILDTIAKQGHLGVDLGDLKNTYTRRGLKRLTGTRNEKGELVEPEFASENTDDEVFTPVKRFEINQNSANINMLVSRPARLVSASTGAAIDTVAGIRLAGKLQTHNNYTVVGNGEVSLSSMRVRVESKKGFRALKAAGVVQGDYDPSQSRRITFTGRPLVSFDQKYGPLAGLFEKVAGIRALVGILKACTRQESDDFTADQIKELKAHGLSTSLNFNFPTTNTYTSLVEALAKGEVDSRLAYKVDLGTTSILNPSKVKSANVFLQRLFTMEVEGEKVKKPVFADFWGATSFGYKKLSSRTKITEVDLFQQRIFEDFLRLKDTGAVEEILKSAGIEGKAADLLLVASHPGEDKDAGVELMVEVKRTLEDELAQTYREKISPLAFYVGATGLVPDDLGATAYNSEDLKAKFPNLVLSKGELEGTFFVMGDCILSVYMKSEYFTPDTRS